MSTKAKAKLSTRPAGEMLCEINRVEQVLAEIARSMNDPERGIGDTVRLSVYYRELKAYLQGIRYSLGEQEKSL